MSEVIAIAPFTIQDAPDGPGELTQADKGLIFAWDGERMIVIPPQQIAQQAQPVLLRAGGGAWNIQNAVDGPGTLTVADDGKALSWSNTAGRFVMATLNAADADTLDGLDSTAFLRTTGAVTGATSQAQIFTTGVGIGSGITSPATLFQVVDTSTSSPRGIMSSQYSTTTDGARFHMRKGRGTLATPTTVASGDTLGRLVASGYDGSAYQEMASIAFVSSGTVASTRVPTEIQFFTATDAAPSVMTQRMVIDNAGNVGIANATPSQALDVTGSMKFSGALIGPAWKPASNSTTALQTQDASGAYITNVDTTNKRWGLGTNAPGYQFDMATAETPAGSSNMALHVGNTGGVELITNTTDRDFSGSGNWTGTNWAVTSGALKHTTGSTANAVLANANLTASSIISGRYYQVTYTITGRTAGTVQPKIGTGLGTAQSVDGTYTDYIAAAADNADLIFTPTSAFDGSIDNVSVQRIGTNFVIGNNGKVGIGTTAPLLAFEVIDGTNTPLNIVRRSAVTSASSGTFNAVHETSGVALDGFGAHQSFRIKDNTSGTTFTIAQLGGVRDGAMDTGGMVFRTTTANVINERMRISTNGHLGLGTTTPTARVHVAGNASFAAWGLNGSGLLLAAATYTDSSTAASGTATNAVAYAFKRPTFAATNSSVTMTNTATVYIENSPTNGTNATLTNKYALWVDDGDTRLDGNIGFYGTAPAAKQTVTGSRGSNAALASLLTALATLGLITDSSS